MFAEINIRNMATVNRVMCACGGIYYCQSRTFANALKRRAIRVLTLEDAELLHRKKRLKGKKNTDEVDGQIPKGRGRTETDDRPSNRDKGVAGELSSNAPVNTSYEKLFPGDKRFGLA
jgi:hypothetical protein